MSKASDVVVGSVIGAAVLGSLGYLMTPIPYGWIIASTVAGYYAGRLGDWWSGVIMGLASPVIYIVDLMAYLASAPSLIWSESSVVAHLFYATVLSSMINVTFIMVGTAIGARGYARRGGRAGGVTGPGTTVTEGPPTPQPPAQPAPPTSSAPQAAPGAASAPPASTTPAPSGADAQQLRSSLVKLVQAYNRVRASPKDSPFRDQTHVLLMSSMARGAEAIAKSLLRSQPDERRAALAGILKDTLIHELRQRYPSLEPPKIDDPVAQSLLDSVKEAIYRGLLSGSVDSYGASTPDEVNALAALLASDVLMKSLESWLSKVGS